MPVYTDMLKNVLLPDMIPIRQSFSRDHIENPAGYLGGLLKDEKLAGRIRPGMQVAITAGSRGVANIPVILKELAAYVRSLGGEPFLFPAMGSHGGGTAQGQKAVLTSLGVTEEFCGCPVKASMEVTQISTTPEGHPVQIDRYAAEADAVIVVNRIKPHTAFRGPYESGLMKMMTIGMGKHAGAQVCHQAGFGAMHHLVPLFGHEVLQHGKIAFGVALLENAYDETCRMEILLPEEIEEKEPLLLKEAYSCMGKLLFNRCDVLIIDQIGKDFSGEGADPNISGAFPTPFASGGIDAERRVCLGLSSSSHGCAYGCGLFDSISKRLYESIDPDATYTNAITNTVLTAVQIPVVMPNDRDAIAVALRSCNHCDPSAPRIIRIANTAHIENILISPALLAEAQADPRITILGEPRPFSFDSEGNLTDYIPL